MKKMLLILLIIMFVPILVHAETCNNDAITIDSITIKDKTSNVAELETATAAGNTINLNLNMGKLNDTIQYELVVKNNSNSNYYIDSHNINNKTSYLDYSFETQDKSNVIKANSTKTVYLSVNYKKEIPKDKFNSGLYNDTTKVKLPLSTKNPILNPKTGSQLLLLVLLIIIITIISIFIVKKKNKKVLMIISIILLIPIGVFAICKGEIIINSTITIKNLPKLNQTIIDSASENSCVVKYEGNVTEKVGETVPATKVYFDKCDNNTLIFANQCWKVIRTTETGGTKVIYDGSPVDGKCESNRQNTPGIKRIDYTNMSLAYPYMYGNSFKYDTNTKTFTLEDTTTAVWNDYNYKDLLGKYTCRTSNDTCETIYFVNDYYSNSDAYLISYVIDDISYSSIAYAPYNADTKSLAMVGYKYNKKYHLNYKCPYSRYKYSTSFTYNRNTNTYTLSGDIKTLSGGNDWYEGLDNAHYTCWNESGECSSISYIYSIIYNDDAYYINLDSGKGIDDALSEMLTDSSVNKYDSNAKSIVDNWYKNNMLNYTDKLEDVVYCNNRRVKQLAGWDKNTSNIRSGAISFGNDINTNLECPNTLDQFSTNNNKAKLSYPVALITNSEARNYGPPYSLMSNSFWSMSPNSFNTYFTYVDYYTIGSYYTIDSTLDNNSIRPVISLDNGALITSGSGTDNNPWIIE